MIKVAFIVPDNRDEFYQYDAPEPIFGPAPAALLQGFTEVNGCEIHILSANKQPVKASPKLAHNIYFHSIHTPMFGRFRTLYAGSFVGIRRLLKKLQPDIVHGQGAERYPALAAATSGFPSVVTLHGIVSQLAKVQKARKFSFLGVTAMMEASALKRTSGAICLSRHSQRIVSTLCRRTWCVPNAVESPFFEVERAPVDPPEIIYAAHIYELKNQIGLIKALDPVAAKHRFTLRLLGKTTGTPYSREVEELAGARPWCRLDGFLKGSELRRAFARATLLAHPSFEENCPMAVLEAMAAGIAVGASNAGGIPDLVEEGRTGLLFDPHNIQSIGAAIKRILIEPRLAENMGKAGRIRAEREYRPAAIARRHLEIYREVLGR